MRSLKSLLSQISQVFTGEDLVQWLLKNLQITTQEEAMHLGSIFKFYFLAQNFTRVKFDLIFHFFIKTWKTSINRKILFSDSKGRLFYLLKCFNYFCILEHFKKVRKLGHKICIICRLRFWTQANKKISLVLSVHVIDSKFFACFWTATDFSEISENNETAQNY